MSEYLADSVFLAQANNEKGTDEVKASIKARFSALSGAMLVKFNQDMVVYPRESEWFQGLNNLMKVQPLDKEPFYYDDYIGLKKLNDEGKVQWIALDGDHLQFTEADVTNIFVPFLLS